MRTGSGRETKRKREGGATVVEFAVIVAILFAILVGILEFGFIFLQEHLVANAAREGVRIGVRANNYNAATFGEFAVPVLTTEACASTTDRGAKVDCEVRNYLQGTLYPDRSAPNITVSREVGSTVLEVRVDVENFFPDILAGWVSALSGGSFAAPTRIVYTANGDYEDPDEASEGF